MLLTMAMKSPTRTLGLATPHAAATEAGRAAFAAGGNAVDAALAACATLTVVYPHMCSIGGDAIALVHAPDGGVTCVNGSGAAPLALDAARVRAAIERQPTPLTRTGMPERGPHTVTVPGVLAAWETLRELGARFDLARLLKPAIGFARDGCTVSRSLAATLAWEPDLFAADAGLRGIFFATEGRAAVHAAAARPLDVGDVFVQPALAISLEAIARDGVGAFYKGALGGDYVAGLRALGSVMTRDDLARHETDVCEPLLIDAFGYEFLTAPPNSQGYVLLQIMAARALTESAAGNLTVAETARLFALVGEERDRHLCDPRGQPMPLEELLDPAHVRALLDRAQGRGSGTPTDERERSGDSPGERRTREAGGDAGSGDTIACVAADSEGWAVSIIQSVYHGFGSAILEPRTGIVAHDRGACFSLDPSSPNLIAGGRRPLHTLMPLLVLRDGRLTVVAGTMGGEAQPQIHAQILERVLAARAERTPADADGAATPITPDVLAAALAGPRWIWDEGTLWAEADVPADHLTDLRTTGMPLTLLDRLDESVGHGQYVAVQSGTPTAAASDPRSDGDAIVAVL